MTTAPQVSERGLRLIEKWEGCYLTAYKDSVGIWTIGWGTITNKALGIFVYPGQRITREQAEIWLAVELREKEAGVCKLVKVPLTSDQYDTLVSFAYNVGLGALANSTLLKLLNQRNYSAVPAQLLRFSHGGGREIKGLLNRRQDECRLWRGEHVVDVPDHASLVPVRINPATIKAKVADNALETTLSSRTGKAVQTQIVVAMAGGSQALLSPVAIAVVAVVILVGGYVLYRKYKDTQEFR